jgi:hypothetical protein
MRIKLKAGLQTNKGCRMAAFKNTVRGINRNASLPDGSVTFVTCGSGRIRTFEDRSRLIKLYSHASLQRYKTRTKEVVYSPSSILSRYLRSMSTIRIVESQQPPGEKPLTWEYIASVIGEEAMLLVKAKSELNEDMEKVTAFYHQLSATRKYYKKRVYTNAK